MAQRRMGGGAADRALTQIDLILAAGGPEAVKLWDILSALRGPDNPQQSGFKDRTTNVIRSAAFPETAKKATRQAVGFDAAFASPQAGQVVITGYQGLTGSHFGSHAEKAVQALGLDLDRRDPQVVARQAATPRAEGQRTATGCGSGTYSRW